MPEYEEIPVEHILSLKNGRLLLGSASKASEDKKMLYFNTSTSFWKQYGEQLSVLKKTIDTADTKIVEKPDCGCSRKKAR